MPIETQHITATEVPTEARLNFLPKYFGARIMVQAETLVYRFMDEFCRAYAGAFWRYYELSNGGFYMAPDVSQDVRIAVQSNDFDRVMSPDAAGIVTTLFALSHLTFELQDDPLGAQLTDHFHSLRDFAAGHEEAGLIFSAID